MEEREGFYAIKSPPTPYPHEKKKPSHSVPLNPKKERAS